MGVPNIDHNTVWSILKPIFVFQIIVINCSYSTFERHIKSQTNNHSPFWHNARLPPEDPFSGLRHGLGLMKTSLLMCLVVSRVLHQSLLSASIPLSVSLAQFHLSRSGCRYIPTYTIFLQMKTEKSFIVIKLGIFHMPWAQQNMAY